MQLIIRHKVPDGLSLPINYNHILQSMIFRHLKSDDGNYHTIHDCGAKFSKRVYKLFVFSLIRGRYHRKGRQIIFEDTIEYEVRSPEARLIQVLANSIKEHGIFYGETHFDDIELEVRDYEVESDQIRIRMTSPVCVYSTESESGFTHYYAPEDAEFAQMIQDNFLRKYQAYCGVTPQEGIEIIPTKVTERDKFITRYKNTYINGWNGEYLLKGKRKYLDFLYQTGIGSKNAQGFGMFQIVE